MSVYVYNKDFDVLVLKVNKQYNYGKTIEMDEEVLLDLDENNIPVAFEMIRSNESDL